MFNVFATDHFPVSYSVLINSYWNNKECLLKFDDFHSQNEDLENLEIFSFVYFIYFLFIVDVNKQCNV